MQLFNRLPGFIRTPPGLLLLGTLVLALPSLAARIFIVAGNESEIATQVMTVDIYGISLVVLHWTVLLTVAIGAFIVMVMKGPAYVADPYPLVDSEHPHGLSHAGTHARD